MTVCLHLYVLFLSLLHIHNVQKNIRVNVKSGLLSECRLLKMSFITISSFRHAFSRNLASKTMDSGYKHAGMTTVGFYVFLK